MSNGRWAELSYINRGTLGCITQNQQVQPELIGPGQPNHYTQAHIAPLGIQIVGWIAGTCVGAGDCAGSGFPSAGHFDLLSGII